MSARVDAHLCASSLLCERKTSSAAYYYGASESEAEIKTLARRGSGGEAVAGYTERFDKVRLDGDTLVANDGSGRSVTVPDRRTDRIKTDVKVDDNGDVTVTRVDPLGGDPVIDRIPNMMGGAVPKAVRDLQREAITNIEQFYANPTLPKTDATVNEQSRAMSIAGALVQSNHGEAGFAQLNQGNVAELARLIAKGDPSVTVERKMIGGVDTPVRATYRGQQYLLVPRSRLEAARGGGAPAQGSQQQVGGPPLPRAAAQQTQGGRVVSGTITRPAPKAGEVIDGYRFKGGDPRNQASWEPA